MIAIIGSSLIGIITNQHDDQLPVSLFTNNCKPVDKHLSLCNIWKVKSTNIYAWPCGLIVIMANVWHVGPGIEGCGFEFWQRLSFLFCLGAGCKFLYFKDHWHDRMEIKESKVNAELSQVRDSYVWVTTVYSSLDHVCPTSCWWSMYNHIYLKCPSQHCVWWILRFFLNQIYLFNILLLHGQNFWWQLCIYRSRRRFGEHERSVARGAKVFSWVATTLVFWWTVIPIWKTRMS